MKKLLLFTLLASLLAPVSVRAQQQADLSLAVSPAIIELSGDPGQSFSSTVTFQNTGNEPIAGFLGTEALVPVDNFIDQARRSNFDASAWIELEEKTIAFDAEQRKTLNFTVTIPEEASPGGHYALITLTPGVIDAPRDATTVSPQLSASLLITVSGDINESAEIVDDDLAISNITRGDELNLSFRIRNLGNVHILPAPRVTISKDGEIVEIFSLQPQLILPNTEKVFEVPTWLADVDYGTYQIRAEATYGNQSIPLATTEHEFLVVPNYLLIAVWIFLAVGILLLFVKRKNIPRTMAVLRGHANFSGRNYTRYSGDEKLPESAPDTKELEKVARAIEEENRPKTIFGLPDMLHKKESDEIKTMTHQTPTPKPKVISETRVKNNNDSTTFITQTSASTIVREKSPFFDPDEEPLKQSPKKSIQVRDHEDVEPVEQTKKTTAQQKAATKKAVAKKNRASKKPAAKKTTTKKSPVKKTAMTSKKSTSTKAPTKKSTAKKATQTTKPKAKSSTAKKKTTK